MCRYSVCVHMYSSLRGTDVHVHIRSLMRSCDCRRGSRCHVTVNSNKCPVNVIIKVCLEYREYPTLQWDTSKVYQAKVFASQFSNFKGRHVYVVLYTSSMYMYIHCNIAGTIQTMGDTLIDPDKKGTPHFSWITNFVPGAMNNVLIKVGILISGIVYTLSSMCM